MLGSFWFKCDFGCDLILCALGVMLGWLWFCFCLWRWCGKESENVGGAELGGWEVLIKRSGNRAGPIRPICNEHKRCIHVSYTIEMYNRVCT